MSAQALMTIFLGNMVWASLFMLVVLAVRRPFAAAFGAVPAYALWLLPALRLIAPPLPAWHADIPVSLPPQTLILFVGDAAAPLPPEGGPGQWVPMMLAIWALGAAAFIAWQWLGYRRFLNELSLSSRSLGAHRGLPLVESAAVQGPLALGLLDRRIVVPADFDTRYSAEERRLALDHESIHHRRGDIWWNHLGLLILALNWFNPIAWFAFRAFRTDQELACDAAVAARASADARHDYARALIKSASRPGLIAACPLNHAAQLKRRLKMMKTHRSSRLRMLGGAAAVAMLAGLGMAVGSPGFAQDASATPPTPPTPTTPPAAAPSDGTRRERIIVRTIDGGEAHQTTTIGRVGHGGAGGHGDHAAHGAHAAGSGEHGERVIIMSRRVDGHGALDAAEHHMRMLHGEGAQMAIPDCGGAGAFNVEGGDANHRTRIVLCSRANATPAERAERLQRARDRLAGDSELSAEQKAHITAMLDQEIARLRGR